MSTLNCQEIIYLFIIRFVNMVAKVEDDDFLWGEMRTMRDIFNNEKQTNSCYVLVSDELIKEHFQNLSQILSIDDIDNKAKVCLKTSLKKVLICSYI